MNGKTIAIVSYITLVGWIIALIINLADKDYFASFHIRQSLGVLIMGAATGFFAFIPPVGFLLGLITFIFWAIGLFSAINGRTTPVPILGEKFQEWFKSL